MRGMSATTGKPLSGVEHLLQSIADILFTPIGSRLRRRDYGSEIPFLIDQPQNPLTRIKIYGAAATALFRWEPRIRLSRLDLRFNAGGQAALDLEVENLEQPAPASLITLTLPLRASAAGTQPA